MALAVHIERQGVQMHGQSAPLSSKHLVKSYSFAPSFNPSLNALEML
jgi:hypothetical protein